MRVHKNNILENIQMTWTNYLECERRFSSPPYAPSFAYFPQLLYVNDRFYSHHIQSIINQLALLKNYKSFGHYFALTCLALPGVTAYSARLVSRSCLQTNQRFARIEFKFSLNSRLNSVLLWWYCLVLPVAEKGGLPVLGQMIEF